MTGTIIEFAAHRRDDAKARPANAPELAFSQFVRDMRSQHVMATDWPPIGDIGPDGELMKPTKKRWWIFKRAEMYMEFVEKSRDVFLCGHMLFEDYGIPECKPHHVSDPAAAHWAWAAKIHAARVGVLMAPVCQRSQLDLKRRILSQGNYDDELDEIERVMKADEAYIAIPRQHRNAALRKAVRP